MMLGVKVTLKYLNVGQISPVIGLDLGFGLALPPSLGRRLGLGAWSGSLSLSLSE